MKHLKNVLTSLLIALITIVFVYGGYASFAKHDDEVFEDSWFFWTTKLRYHHEMNEYFNEKFKNLYEYLKEDEDFFKPESEGRKLLTPPTDEKINECEINKAKKDELTCLVEECGKENLSSYCVAVGALETHLRYIKKLDELQGNIPDTNDVDCVYRAYTPIDGAIPLCANVSSLENLLGYVKARNEAMNAEYDSSKRIMEVAINTYNEFILAYPMHLKYESILTNLTKYKKALKSIKNTVIYFPLKFVGTSSYSCT